MSVYGRTPSLKGPVVEEKRSIVALNVNSRATDEDLTAFFGYCGDIHHMGVHSDTQNPGSKRVVVTFKEESGAEMAMLLTDTTFLEQEISISSVKVSQSRFTIGELRETFTSLMRPKREVSAYGVMSNAPTSVDGRQASLLQPDDGQSVLSGPAPSVGPSVLRRRKKSGIVTAEKMSGTEEAIEKQLERFSKRVKEMTQAQKTAAAGSLVLATAGALFVGKSISNKRRKESEVKTKALLAAYDHLFACGPTGCQGEG